MMHPRVSIKSSSQWLNRSFLIELLSVCLIFLLIFVVITPVIVKSRISNLDCFLDNQICDSALTFPISNLLEQPVLFNDLKTRLLNNPELSGYNVLSLAITLPKTLRLDLKSSSPKLLVVDGTNIMAIAADGKVNYWSNNTLPNNVPQITVSSNSNSSPSSSINIIKDARLNQNLLTIINSIQNSDLKYVKLQLIDPKSLQLWLSDRDWAILDIRQPVSVQNLSSILNHPGFKDQIDSGYHLDLRFQYPLLLKMD